AGGERPTERTAAAHTAGTAAHTAATTAADVAQPHLPGFLSRPGLNAAARQMLLLPVWLQALAVYLVTRILTLGIMGAVVRTQVASPWTTGATTSLNDFLNFWDAGWYQRIADEWYPSQLPLTETGDVAQNQWAFYPLHPLLVRDVQFLLPLDYRVISPILSMVFAAIAAILILHLFRLHSSPGRALTGLAFVFTFPASPVLMTGYAEALTLMLLAAALLLVVRRRYLLALPIVVLLDLSRPIGVAFSFFMLVHLIGRIRRRRTDPYPPAEVVRSWALGVGSCAAALIQPAYAWIATGSPTAYTDTEAAWTGHSKILLQWVDRAEGLVGGFGIPLLLVTVALFVGAILSPAGAAMGRVCRQFTLAYGVYLLLFFTPQTSTLRLMLPMFPFALILAQSRSWTARFAILTASIVFQIVWVAYLWKFTPPADFPP
ncbi:hypothetical protein GSY69_12630, partial [Brevibacterium sp. 5221]